MDRLKPQGQYALVRIYNGFAYVAGITPRIDGALAYVGVVGDTISVEAACAAAALAATNALNALLSAVRGEQDVQQCLRLVVYLVCAPGFTQHAMVADAATGVITEALGDRGLPVRSTVGVANLPGGSPVEVELTAAVARLE